jgi:hypothetical protein
MMDNITKIGLVKTYSQDDRPEDGQTIVYLFEPFNSWYIGKYIAEYDSVEGSQGFTTWDPEVIAWFPQRGPRND